AQENRNNDPDGRAEFPRRTVARRRCCGHGLGSHCAYRAHGRPCRRRGAAEPPARPVAACAPMTPLVPGQDEPLPEARIDAIPLVILAATMLCAFLAIGSSSTWLTLTIAG